MVKEIYIIHLFERKSICPLCSGMLTAIGEDLRYRCIDCNSRFRVVDEGLTDKEAMCELINGKEEAI